MNYSHQMLGAALVKPGLKEVIPLAPEPIIQTVTLKKIVKKMLPGVG